MSKKKTAKKTLKTADTKAATEKAAIITAGTVAGETDEPTVDATNIKGADKNIRAPIGEEPNINKLSQADKVRMATGKQLNLDASFYERLPEYQDMQLFYENNENGAVEKWLHLGAGLVPRRNKSLKEYKGFTDQATSEWECTPVGSDASGNPLLCYLLFMPAEEYKALRIDPKEKRNAEILDVLGMGKSQADGAVMSNVKGIKTYAPNNPVGDGKGFEQTHEA